jgi:uncharacterized protein YaiI (UPF0178 family)
MKILMDADACPRVAKEILYKASNRLNIEVILVANQFIRAPQSKFIKSVVVAAGADEADDHIVEIMEQGDLIITADIPLADRVVKKGGVVLDPRGIFLTADNIGQRLAVRNLMDDLRSSGVETGGPNSYGPKERQEFANQLDKFLTRALRGS